MKQPDCLAQLALMYMESHTDHTLDDKQKQSMMMFNLFRKCIELTAFPCFEFLMNDGKVLVEEMKKQLISKLYRGKPAPTDSLT